MKKYKDYRDEKLSFEEVLEKMKEEIGGNNMKVIDLLNKIATDEKINYEKQIEIENRIITIGEFLCSYILNKERLNDEIKMIDEKEMCHKCNKYPAEYNQTECEFCLGTTKKIQKLSYQQIGTYELDNGDTRIFVDSINKQITQIGRKINEIINHINKENLDD